MSVKSRLERGVLSVNAELPVFMVKWLDEIAQKYESSRSGILRIAVRELMAMTGTSKSLAANKTEAPKA